MLATFIDVSNLLTATAAAAIASKFNDISLFEQSTSTTLLGDSDSGSLTNNTTATLLNNDSMVSITRTKENDYEDGFIEYVPPLERPETIIIAVLLTLIFVVGVLGNGTLVVIFFRHRSMRNIPNTYILSLALADLLVIIICVPLTCVVYTAESWTLGRNLCRITESFKDISIGVSVFTLTALSGERYCAIVNPLRKLQTKPMTVVTAVMIWILAILFAIPSFVESDLKIYGGFNGPNITTCSPFGQRDHGHPYIKITVVAKAIIYYLLPLSIIGVLYILMARRLHISARDMPGETLGIQSRSQARARRHVARMVVAFVVFFFVCFFPYHLFSLWFHLNPTAEDDFDEFWHAIRIIGFCTSFLNSCINPVALYFVSGVFRQHFNRYLCCFCVKRQPRLRQHSTATGVMDTSIMSMRRSTCASTYNRASMHMHNSSAGTSGSGFHRQSTIHYNNAGNNNVSSAASVGGGGGGGGVAGNGGAAVSDINGSNYSNSNGRINTTTAAQSMILNDKSFLFEHLERAGY